MIAILAACRMAETLRTQSIPSGAATRSASSRGSAERALFCTPAIDG